MQQPLAAGPADTEISVAMLAELATQYQHRLLSLEAELHEHACDSALSEQDFKSRLQTLYKLHADLAILANWASAEMEGEVTTGDIGLPVMGVCTPPEASVCADYLKEKAEHLSALMATAKQLQTWLHGVMLGRVGPLRLTFRLAKMRQVLVQTEQAIGQLRQHELRLDGQVATLLSSLKGTRAHDSGGSTLQTLKSLFMQLNAATQRVAKLTVSVKIEDERVAAMRAWLHQERSQRDASRPAMDPPTPLAFAQAASEASYDFSPARSRDRTRRGLVDQFYRANAGPKRFAPDPATVRRAADLFKTHVSPGTHRDDEAKR